MALSERSFDDPVIEVMSLSPRLEMLQARLRQAGMRPVAVNSTATGTRSDPLLIDLEIFPNAETIAPERLVITLGNKAPEHAAAIHLSDINLLQTLPTRISIRKRERQRIREASLRAETAKQFGAYDTQPTSTHKPRLLWLGQNAPFLNALKSNLKAEGIDLVAALSRLTTEDYLAKGGFDALILYPSIAGDEASQFLKRHLNLDYGSQTKLVLLTTPETSSAIDRANMEKVDAILDLANEPDILSQRLMAFCDTLTQNTPLKKRLASHTNEPTTGLATRAFLEAHLKTQMLDADKTGERLCLIAVSPNDPSKMQDLSEDVKPLLRETDLAARLDQNHICITMPATTYRGAVTLARRIEAEQSLAITWRVIERRRFHTLNTLLGGLTAKAHVPLSRKTA